MIRRHHSPDPPHLIDTLNHRMAGYEPPWPDLPVHHSVDEVPDAPIHRERNAAIFVIGFALIVGATALAAWLMGPR